MSDVDKIRAALAAAKWKKTRSQNDCLGVDSSSTELFVKGSKRFVEQTGGKTALDSTSEKAVEMIGDRIPDGFANPVTPDDVIQP